MLFNSINFIVFLPIVFLTYWLIARKNLKLQNLILLAASFFFYSCWDYRFTFLLIFSILLDYFSGLKIDAAQNIKTKRLWLLTSISINLGVLMVFKYYNFFIGSLSDLFSSFGLYFNYSTLKVVLPIGISFYTFHGLSYILDIFNNRIKPERNLVNYSLFVSFFPLLVAGPIERATHLLPQITKKREFDYFKVVDGLRQILWGFFKKIVIADNCADYVNMTFDSGSSFAGSTYMFASFVFAVQIYCDFSGYSDIALGTARLFGIELLKNFSFPYFSRDIAEFWRRWHISLTSWFRDYVYIPLGGSKKGLRIAVRNTLIVFILSGFWHGANWTFVVWGLLNAFYFLPYLSFNKNRQHIEIIDSSKYVPSLKEAFQILTTFLLVSLAWVFFRSENLSKAFSIIKSIFSSSLLSYPEPFPLKGLVPILLLFIVEWIQRGKAHGLQIDSVTISAPVRWTVYVSLLLVIFFLGKFDSNYEFIYFQF
jgi:alginate O-acetyltransferase complex protein AlgI